MVDSSGSEASTGKAAVQPSSASDEIMEAVYLALGETGYPGLTMADIAAEFDKSKSMLYYHYDGKEALLTAFFTYLSSRLEEQLTETQREDPFDELVTHIERILPPDIDAEQFQFRRAYFEIRSQAPHHRPYHEQLSESDELLIEAFQATIDRGVEDGRFRAVDPSTEAELLLATLYGIIERAVTVDDPSVLERNRDALVDQLERSLVAK